MAKIYNPKQTPNPIDRILACCDWIDNSRNNYVNTTKQDIERTSVRKYFADGLLEVVNQLNKVPNLPPEIARMKTTLETHVAQFWNYAKGEPGIADEATMRKVFKELQGPLLQLKAQNSSYEIDPTYFAQSYSKALDAIARRIQVSALPDQIVFEPNKGAPPAGSSQLDFLRRMIPVDALAASLGIQYAENRGIKIAREVQEPLPTLPADVLSRFGNARISEARPEVPGHKASSIPTQTTAPKDPNIPGNGSTVAQASTVRN